jgi:hypothetical protein
MPPTSVADFWNQLSALSAIQSAKCNTLQSKMPRFAPQSVSICRAKCHGSLSIAPQQILDTRSIAYGCISESFYNQICESDVYVL